MKRLTFIAKSFYAYMYINICNGKSFFFLTTIPLLHYISHKMFTYLDTDVSFSPHYTNCMHTQFVLCLFFVSFCPLKTLICKKNRFFFFLIFSDFVFPALCSFISTVKEFCVHKVVELSVCKKMTFKIVE